MSVEQGAPPANTDNTGVSATIKALVNQAIADPGQWFHIDIPEETTSASVRSTLTYNVAKSVAEWTVKNGKLYFRFGR